MTDAFVMIYCVQSEIVYNQLGDTGVGGGAVSQNLNTKFVLSKSLHTIIEVHYAEIEF